MESAAGFQAAQMNEGIDPNKNEGKGNGHRGQSEHALRVFAEGHGGEGDGRGETDGGGNKTGHEAQSGMIDGGEKVIFAPGTRERRAQLAVTKGAAEGNDSADDPEQNEGEAGMDVGHLKPEARENTCADDIGHNERAGGQETDAGVAR